MSTNLHVDTEVTPSLTFGKENPTPNFSSAREDVPKLSTYDLDRINSGANFSFRSNVDSPIGGSTIIKDESHRSVQKWTKYIPLDDSGPTTVEVSPRLVLDGKKPNESTLGSYAKYLESTDFQTVYSEPKSEFKSTTLSDYKSYLSPAADTSEYKSYTTPSTDYKSYTSPDYQSYTSTTEYKSYTNPSSDYKSYTNPSSDYKSYTSPEATYTTDYKSYTSPTTDYKSYTSPSKEYGSTDFKSYTSQADPPSYTSPGFGSTNYRSYLNETDFKPSTTEYGTKVWEKTEYKPLTTSRDASPKNVGSQEFKEIIKPSGSKVYEKTEYFSTDYTKYLNDSYKASDSFKPADSFKPSDSYKPWDSYKPADSFKPVESSYNPPSYSSKDMFQPVASSPYEREPDEYLSTSSGKVGIIRMDAVHDSIRSDTSEQLRQAESKVIPDEEKLWLTPRTPKSEKAAPAPVVPALDMQFHAEEDDGLSSAERLARDRDRLLAALNSTRMPVSVTSEMPSCFNPEDTSRNDTSRFDTSRNDTSRFDTARNETRFDDSCNLTSSKVFTQYNAPDSFRPYESETNRSGSTMQPCSQQMRSSQVQSQKIHSFNMAPAKRQQETHVYAEAVEERLPEPEPRKKLTKEALNELEEKYAAEDRADDRLEVPAEGGERRGSRASSAREGAVKMSTLTKTVQKYGEMKEGWLLKKHPVDERWAKRWVKVSKGCLSYSLSQQEKPKGMLDFQRCEWDIEVMVTSYSTTWKLTPKGYNRVFCFKLTEEVPPQEIKSWDEHLKTQIKEAAKYRQKTTSLPAKFWKQIPTSQPTFNPPADGKKEKKHPTNTSFGRPNASVTSTKHKELQEPPKPEKEKKSSPFKKGNCLQRFK